DRMSRDQGKLAVSRAACSITGTIQPLILARGITDEDLAAGLLARILVANPPRKRKRWPMRDISEQQVVSYDQLLHELLKLRLKDAGQLDPHPCPLDGPAEKTWGEWYIHWVDRKCESQAEQAAVLANLEGYAARLALIHHVITLASQKSAATPPISNRSMQAG